LRSVKRCRNGSRMHIIFVNEEIATAGGLGNVGGLTIYSGLGTSMHPPGILGHRDFLNIRVVFTGVYLGFGNHDVIPLGLASTPTPSSVTIYWRWAPGLVIPGEGFTGSFRPPHPRFSVGIPS